MWFMTMLEKKIVARVIDIQKENWEKFTTHFSEISSNLDEKCHVLLLIISISERCLISRIYRKLCIQTTMQ